MQIVEQARVAESHIHEIKNTGLTAAVAYRARGQWMGFAALLATLGVSAFAIAEDYPWVAGIALSAVTGIAAVFGTLKKRDGKRQGE